MPKSNLDKVCMSRLAAPDFAKHKEPVLSKTEWVFATVMLTVLLLGMVYMTVTHLPA